MLRLASERNGSTAPKDQGGWSDDSPTRDENRSIRVGGKNGGGEKMPPHALFPMSSSTSANVGMEGAVPGLVTEMPAVAQP